MPILSIFQRVSGLLSCSNNTDTVTGHELSTYNTDHLNSVSNYDISVGVSSSEDDCDLSDSNLWVDTKEDIPDFNFESTLSGIKINVPESARDAPIDLFKLLWTDDIFNNIIDSTNNYDHKNKTEKRPHNKYFRKTTFNEINKD